MGAPWVDHPSWELVDVASRATGRDVAHLLLHADADELTETRNSQLATFVLSLVALDAVRRVGVQPQLAAGHSLGEYSALVASGVLSFDDGCRIVLERGEGMQAAANERRGTMFAVLGLDDDQVEKACDTADGDAWVANYNAPGQVVIAGDPDALTKAGELAKSSGAKRAMALPVGGAFHTPYMAPARDRLRSALEAATFAKPEVPVIANVDALAHTTAEDWLELCTQQLTSPVRWRQSATALIDHGANLLVELGPGSVLTNLVKRIAPDTRAISVSSPEDIDGLVDAMTEGTPANEELTTHHEHGEHLTLDERLIVSTATGLFDFLEPPDGPSIDDMITIGQPIAKVGDTEITTPFAGKLMGILAIAGERVTVGQPIAWLRSEA
jgi:[acyl-carrier-protein] S-malonyltransferase